ncbi:fibronectin type III domain-containing protein, partial [Labilibaculum sp. K2S]|uniref:fibronectin type III domain-containing protein n=1 Tax=Labilibaculum sp. K2S TaxID=3056386 RepID=UPI0025A41852
VTPVAGGGVGQGIHVKASSFIGPILPNEVPTASSVTIAVASSLKEGYNLTGSYTYSDTEGDANSGTTLQWYRADDNTGTGEAAITGATSSTYTMTGTDVGKFIRFGVVPKAATGNSPGLEAFSNYTGVVLANEVPTASNVTYTGTLRSFEVLTGTYSYSDTEGNTNNGTSFKWYRADDATGTNKTAISGAVAAAYTLATADVGKYIAYAVTPASLTGNSPGLEVLSAYQGPVLNNEAPTATNVTFTGDLFINKTLTGTYTYTDAEGETQGGTTQKWYRADDAAGTNKTAISGAVAATYTLTAADVGKYIAYAVTPASLTGNSPGLEVLSAYQGPVLNNEAPTATNVTFTGSLVEYGALTGTYDYADAENDPDDSSTYQWYRADDAAGTNKTAISGATASTYKLAAADVDKYIAYTVTPASSMGTSPGLAVLSAYQGPVLNVFVPDAPTGISAMGGNAQATVTFTAPASDGGLAITFYTVTCVEDDTKTASGTSSPLTVTGLTNGTAYTFTVKANNEKGMSVASAASNSVTPVTVPDAPTLVSAVGGDTEATVSFAAPANYGGSAITSYTVTCVEDNTKTASGSGSPITVTGLTNGTAYTFIVTATNAEGTGAASTASTPVTPVKVPDAPTAVSAVAGNAQATVSFAAPADEGDSPITSYTVISNPASIAATGPSSPITVTGLTNFTTYTFTVTATNNEGTSAASTASTPVTPKALEWVSSTGTSWSTGVITDEKVNAVSVAPAGFHVATSLEIEATWDVVLDRDAFVLALDLLPDEIYHISDDYHWSYYTSGSSALTYLYFDNSVRRILYCKD